MKSPSLAPLSLAFILIGTIPACVTTSLGPAFPVASPQERSGPPAAPATAQQTAPDTIPKKSPSGGLINPQTQIRSTQAIQPVYVLGRPPAGKGKPKSATSTQIEAALDRLAPKRPRPGDHEIFSRYAPGGSQRANNWMRGLDFSGVAWDQHRTATLISDRHVVMARHYARTPGAKITFHDRNGRPVTRRLADVVRPKANPDVTVGLLDQPVPPTVTFYPILADGDYSKDLKWVDLLCTNKLRRVYRIEVLNAYHSKGTGPKLDTIRTGNLSSRPIHKDWDTSFISGDSGNPAFLVVNGQLVLVSTHTFGGGGTNGPFFGGSHVNGFVRSAIRQLNQRFQ